MAFKKTRKHKKQNKHNKTIPEIRKTLESISSAINTSNKSLTLDQHVKKFMKDWKKGVGKNIPYKLAREYVELRMRSYKGTRRRKHSGGMAPLDYETRPGIYGGHGQSLPYVSHDTRGFWGSGISGACGLTPKPNMSGGSYMANLVGAPLTGMNLRIPSGSPPTIMNDFSAGINGGVIPGKPFGAESAGSYHNNPVFNIPGGNITSLPPSGTIL